MKLDRRQTERYREDGFLIVEGLFARQADRSNRHGPTGAGSWMLPVSGASEVSPYLAVSGERFSIEASPRRRMRIGSSGSLGTDARQLLGPGPVLHRPDGFVGLDEHQCTPQLFTALRRVMQVRS